MVVVVGGEVDGGVGGGRMTVAISLRWRCLVVLAKVIIILEVLAFGCGDVSHSLSGLQLMWAGGGLEGRASTGKDREGGQRCWLKR